MKVKIGDQIYDSEIQPMMLIFDNDEQRKSVVKHLGSMEPIDGVRKYAIFKDGTPIPEIENFMKI
jgi:hypothetical protein